MRKSRPRLIIVLALLAPVPAGAQSPGEQCRRAISAAEQAAGIPQHLMAAIGRVESGQRELDGTINPWPWSINANGADQVFDTKQAAIAAVRALQRQGARSIDVGCMQVNLLHHPDAFASLDDAFDPAANAGYAARFLLELRARTGSWTTATAWYHSATPRLGEEYRRKVMAIWPTEQQRGGKARTDLIAVWAASRSVGTAATLPIPHVVPGRAELQASNQITNERGSGAGRKLADYRAAPIPLAPMTALRPPPITKG